MVRKFSEKAQQPKYELQKSQKAFSTIVMAIYSSQLYLITSVEQPKDAWDALRNNFECDTVANKLILKKHYFRTETKRERLWKLISKV